jgi:hypothetical protein
MSETRRWTGDKDRECGKHGTLRGQPWCQACGTSCSPGDLCAGCELPMLRRSLTEALEARWSGQGVIWMERCEA